MKEAPKREPKLFNKNLPQYHDYMVSRIVGTENNTSYPETDQRIARVHTRNCPHCTHEVQRTKRLLNIIKNSMEDLEKKSE